jgi:hypothetical protein
LHQTIFHRTRLGDETRGAANNLSVDSGGGKRLKGESKPIKCDSIDKAFGKVIDLLKKPVN